MVAQRIAQSLGDLDQDAFVDLLRKLIGESKHVQNNPPDLIPEEDRVVNHVLDVLNPYSTSAGGPLVINHIAYVEKRGNLIVEYPGTEKDKIVSFVGMHMDVVTANPSEWKFDPFSLSIDGDQLRGRGTTDCLGHVALVTGLMKTLGEKKPKLKSSVVAIFIASEENSSIPGVGVEELYKNGWFDKLKPGPLYWVDTSDKQPCIGTGGTVQWHFQTLGKLFHSGLPDKAINPLELGMEALKVLQFKFYQDFPADPREEEYKFEIPSTMKPTQWTYPGGSINQIPGECTISGDVRLTPFYSVNAVQNKLQVYVDWVNANVEWLPTRGPASKYVLPDECLRGKVSIQFGETISGIACDLNSRGYQVLAQATKEVIGHVAPYSITGSLPLVRELQDNGYDVQNIGYGLMDTYHADNEYCNLSDMVQGYAVFTRIISLLEED